jgi:hypothetical protein
VISELQRLHLLQSFKISRPRPVNLNYFNFQRVLQSKKPYPIDQARKAPTRSTKTARPQMPSSSVMISMFCSLFAAASVQLLTSSPSPNPAPRIPDDAASSMTFQSLPRRNWILDPHAGASHLPPPSLLAMLIFPMAILLVYLIPRGLPVTTQPVWRYRHTHGQRATQQERASFGIKAANPSQAAFIWPSTAIAGTCPVPPEDLTEPQTQRPCGPLGAWVQGCEEGFQHTPTPTKQPSAKSQKTRKLNSFSLLAVATLPAVLSYICSRGLDY